MADKKIISCICLMLILSVAASVGATGIAYFPDVTSDMSDYRYWAKEDEVLMSVDQIYDFNSRTIAKKETYMYDLKAQPETVDGVALNEALIKSSGADAAYYLGWTYIESNTLALKEDYDEMINNTQNPNASKVQNVLYGVAVHRTELRTFPSPKAIWDDPADADLDYQFLSAVRVNEPLVITSVSADGKYYLAKNICCSGWVPAEDVAACSDKEQWLSAWDIAPEDAVVVYGDKVYTEISVTGPQTSGLMLTMGTVLERADVSDPNVLIDNRAAYQNYAVWVPVRNSDGSYDKKLTLISEHNKVHSGYLPLTKKNISMVAFSALGNTYGWGGGLLSDDCSGYVRNIYKCFGLELARNTTWQSAMPMAKVDMQYMCREEREAMLDKLPFGTVLYFSGHEMMYLGKANGKYYVLSSVGSVMQPGNDSVRQRIRSIVINTLEVKRANGNTWLDELTLALVPYWEEASDQLPGYEWYHDGVAFCIKNGIMKGDEDKHFNPDDNILWAEFLQILYNMEEHESSEVAESVNWYDAAVEWATASGFIYEELSGFDPESAMTREELASVLYRYGQFKNKYTDAENANNLSAYEDAKDVATYAVSAFEYMLGEGLMRGKTDTTINPKDYTTRAEVAVITERFKK